MRSTPEHERRKRRAVLLALFAVAGLGAWFAAAFALGSGQAGIPAGVETTSSGKPEAEGNRTPHSSPKPHPGEGVGKAADSSPNQPGPDGGAGSGKEKSAFADTGAEGGSASSEESAAPADLPETARERAYSAAGRFVGAVFGYTGGSTGDYLAEIEKAALMQGIYASPANAVIGEYQGEIDDGGLTSAAVMDHFEITSAEPHQVRGVAYFRVGDSYNDTYTDVKGPYVPFSEEMTLCPAYETYQVCAAEVHREVTEDYAYYEPDAEQGSKEQGSKEQGSKEQGSKEQGSKEQGSKEQGSKEQGSKEQGSKEQGSEEIGHQH